MRVIAIDGPAGSGKSTVARRVAEELGLAYLDTGAMYRSVAFAVLRDGVDPADTEAVAALAPQLSIDVGERVTVDGVDATMLVDLDQPSVQARERERILPAEEEIPLRLEPEESRQSVELAAVKNQIALERRQADRDVADAAFEAVDPGVDRVDLGRELLRTLLRLSDASVQRRQPGIDGMLAAVDVSRCRRCDHSREDGERCQGCTPHQGDFREPPGRPCTGVP